MTACKYDAINADMNIDISDVIGRKEVASKYEGINADMNIDISDVVGGVVTGIGEGG